VVARRLHKYCGFGVKSFTANVDWGKGPHIMIAVPI
jgi:hypothetical protein